MMYNLNLEHGLLDTICDLLYSCGFVLHTVTDPLLVGCGFLGPCGLPH